MTDFGVGTYTRNVVRALSRLDHDSDYFLIGPPDRTTEIGPLPPNFRTVPLHEPDTSLKGYLGYRAIVTRLQCTVVHVPHLFWAPRYSSCPYIVTVHDVLEHMSGARGLSGLRRSLHFQLTRRALK